MMGRDLNGYRKRYYIAKNMNDWGHRTVCAGEPVLLAFCFGILDNGKFVDDDITIRIRDGDDKDVTGRYLRFPYSRTGMQYAFLDHGLQEGRNLVRVRCVTGDGYRCGLDYSIDVVGGGTPGWVERQYMAPEEWFGRRMTSKEEALLKRMSSNMAFLERRRKGIPEGRYPEEFLDAVFGYGTP